MADALRKQDRLHDPSGAARDDSREDGMRALAEELQFKVEKTERGFTLTRTADLSRPERAEDLTLPQAEALLRTWKLRGLGGGCQFPIAAHAIIEGDELKLEGLVAKPDGSEILRGASSGTAEDGEGIGAALAARLIDQGAGSLLSGQQHG